MTASAFVKFEYKKCKGCASLAGCVADGRSFDCLDCSSHTHAQCLDDFSSLNSKESVICPTCNERGFKSGFATKIRL